MGGGHNCFQLIKLEVGGPGIFDQYIEKTGGPRKNLGKYDLGGLTDFMK